MKKWSVQSRSSVQLLQPDLVVCPVSAAIRHSALMKKRRIQVVILDLQT